ncbi:MULTISPECIES: hypothetical protein [Cyanophyceae]|uniref:hypothetical protein n=1 Tax=Cyanophyceae TaxID=3028117 RepID=UPI0016884659|nr:hypothetical protein [Trichocoleus sp. FACHB-40]MBD2002935.1 hypothetical protein [Trichocoleus sp. FACHB-40]
MVIVESDRNWLRWYDANSNWIITPQERESQRLERLAEQLRDLDVEPYLDDEME